MKVKPALHSRQQEVGDDKAMGYLSRIAVDRFVDLAQEREVYCTQQSWKGTPI